MEDVLTTLEAQIDPGHTAIVVVDMQNDFCAEGGYLHNNLKADMSPNGPLARRIMDLVDAGRASGIEIVWIQANYDPKYLSGQAKAKLAEKGIESICCEGGTWGWDFFEVNPAEGELVVEKHTYSGFFGTELDRLLRFRGINTLVMTGVATNVCVESTLRDGYFNGYYIVVPEDCVGSAAQDLHEATLRNVERTFGRVTTADAIKAVWNAAGGLRATA